MGYRQLITDPNTKKVWLHSAANEFGRLAQGVGDRINGTNTIRFMSFQEVPKGRSVTYARFVCELRPMKAEVERTQLLWVEILLTTLGKLVQVQPISPPPNVSGIALSQHQEQNSWA